jgi:O-antigen/teichoic acid export membrane protein
MSVSTDKVQINVLRNLSAVSLNKIVEVAGIVVTVLLVPRLFGAEDFGRFSFVLSLSYLGQILADFGTLEVMGRFVPGMTPPQASQLYMRTLLFKLGAAVVCGLVTTGAALLLTDWMQPGWAILTGLGVGLHIVAWIPFQFSLGLNRVGTWMAEQAWRQWILLLALLALLPPLGFVGSLLALVFMEAFICTLGLWWARDHWRLVELQFEWAYLRPYIRFGLGFFLANLITTTLYRSGPVLVELLTGASTQTGYLNLALGLFLMAYVTISQFAQSLLPTLSGFRANGQTERIKHWLRSFTRYTWLLSWLGVVSLWFVADWLVPLVFGPDFGPAALVLKWISLGIPLTTLLWTGNTVATLTGRGRVKFIASLAALLTFLVTSLGLTPAYGAAGAALALTLAVVANVAVLSIYLRPDFTLDWAVLWPGAAVGGVCLGVLGWLGV